MGKLYIIFGRSAVGKSTIQKLMGKRGFREVVSCTTRPRRQNEVDGIDYHFITLDQFFTKKEMGGLLEDTEYNGWFYGTPRESIDLSTGDYVMVTECEGFKQLRDSLGADNVKGIYLYLSDYWELLKRSIDRQPHATEIQCNEMCRRFLSDKATFAEAEKLSILKINNLNANETVNIIIRNIKNGI